MGKEEKYEETPVSCPGMNPTIKRAENRSVTDRPSISACGYNVTVISMFVTDPRDDLC